MSLHLITPPSSEPVTLSAAKGHLRVDHGDEDGLIAAWTTAARQHAEAVTGRQIMPATWELRMPCFPDSDAAIALPRPPLRSITSIQYVDTAGVTQTWPSLEYLFDAPVGPTAPPGRVVPAFGEVYPTAREVLDAVKVTFSAGYDDVPANVYAAVLLGLGELYANREQPDLAKAMNRLLWPFKVWS